MSFGKLILVRHGLSVYNDQNRFTGWKDVELNEQGISEAEQAVDLLENIKDNVPSMMNYKVHADKSSMFNTPPVFSVYVSLLNMRWLKKMGGVSEIEKLNRKKAQLLYSEIDLNPLFNGHAREVDRSIMNATFNLSDDNFKDSFETMLADAKITALSGHRSVGGYRASMYNAMSIDSVKVLVEVMSELESKI